MESASAELPPRAEGYLSAWSFHHLAIGQKQQPRQQRQERHHLETDAVALFQLGSDAQARKATTSRASCVTLLLVPSAKLTEPAASGGGIEMFRPAK